MVLQASTGEIRLVIDATLHEWNDVIPFIYGDCVSGFARLDLTELRAVDADWIFLQESAIARLQSAAAQSLRPMVLSRARQPITS